MNGRRRRSTMGCGKEIGVCKGEVTGEKWSDFRFLSHKSWRDLQSKHGWDVPNHLPAQQREMNPIFSPLLLVLAIPYLWKGQSQLGYFPPQMHFPGSNHPWLLTGFFFPRVTTSAGRKTRATTGGPKLPQSLFNLIFITDPSRGAQKSSTPKSKCCIKAHFKLFGRNKVTFRSAVSMCCATSQKSPRNDSPGPKNLTALPCTGRKSSWDKAKHHMNYNPNPGAPWRGGLKMGWLRKGWKWV